MNNRQTHFFSRVLQKAFGMPDEIVSCIALNTNKKAIIFIHGFGGHGITSWLNFPGLVMKNSKFSGYDIYYYSYKLLFRDLNSIISLFGTFINTISLKAPKEIRQSYPKLQSRNFIKYKKIIIVSHSLGSVLSRGALINCSLVNCHSTANVQQIMFAPAHNGSYGAKIAAAMFKSVPPLSVLSKMIPFTRIMRQLQPNSPTLEQIKHDTLHIYKKCSVKSITPIRVLIAEKESIVETERYLFDPASETIPDTTHTTVCKPNSSLSPQLTGLTDIL